MDPGMDRRVLWAVVEMEATLAEVRCAALAAEVNLSPSRFAHLFASGTGSSPSRYLHALRMERARLLLHRTFLTVKEVMAQVGVSDASHFSRDFRRYHGISPTAARGRAPARESVFLAAHLATVEVARRRLGDTRDFAKR
jgi:AraC family transcriptional regulator of arabinose operon